MIGPDDIESLFTYSAPVDEQIESTKHLEELGESAKRFAFELLRLVPAGRARGEVIVKLQAVVNAAAERIREAAKRKDRALALAAKAEPA